MSYGTRRLNDVYKGIQNWSLSTEKSDKISLTCVLILYSHLYLRLPNDLFLSYMLTVTQHAFLFSPMHAEYLENLITHNFLILILFVHAYKSRACSLTGMVKTATGSLKTIKTDQIWMKLIFYCAYI